MIYRIGAIVEDESDLEVLRGIIQKIAKQKKFKIEKFYGRGCGNLNRKCRAWANSLKMKRCNSLIIVRDRDTESLAGLESSLRASLNPSPIQSFAIIIPVVAIEAWLLADHDAINSTFKLTNKIKKVAAPETIPRPKERLQELVSIHSEKIIRVKLGIRFSLVTSFT